MEKPEGGNSFVADGNDEDEDEKISLPGLVLNVYY